MNKEQLAKIQENIAFNNLANMVTGSTNDVEKF